MATNLGKVGIAYKGEYDASVAYKQSEYVYYNGSTFLCVNPNGCTGVTPTHDKTNWIYLARGTTENLVASASALGLIKVGTGLSIEEDGTLNADAQKIDVATTDTAGIIKPGTGLSVTEDGTLNAESQKIATWNDLGGGSIY